MLTNIIDHFVLDSPERGALTLPRSNIYISGLINYLSLWLRSIPNANSSLKGTMTILDVLSISGISGMLDLPMAEQYNKVYAKSRQIASGIDSASRDLYFKSTFVSSQSTEEYLLTTTSNLSDHTDNWSYWKTYRPLRLVSTDHPVFVDNFLSGKLVYQNTSPGFVVFVLDITGLALQYASFLNRSSADAPESERGRVVSIIEFINKYIIFPCFAYDTLNLWLLGNYLHPYFSTTSYRLSSVGGALAMRSEIDTLRSDLARGKVHPSIALKYLRFASERGQLRGKAYYESTFRTWDPVITGRQSAGLRLLSRYNWINLILDPALAHGPEYQAIGGDLYLAADQAMMSSLDTRISGRSGKEAIRMLIRRCKEIGSVIKK